MDARAEITIRVYDHPRHGRRVRVESGHGMRSWPIAESGAALEYVARLAGFLVAAMLTPDSSPAATGDVTTW